MKVVILGGSGFIGSALSRALAQRGDTVIVTSKEPCTIKDKHPNIQCVTWNGFSYDYLVQILDGVDAVVNLIGENITAKRWTKHQKQKIVRTRVVASKALAQALYTMKKRPLVLIQASAIGYYGVWKEQSIAPVCTEESPLGKGFLADTSSQWEASTKEIESLGIRRCIIRTAPVLGLNGGFLQKILPFFSLGLGGILGTGKQPFSWIHIDDEVDAIIFLIDNNTLHDVFNLVAPDQISAAVFAKTLGHVLKRVVFLRIPAFILRIMLGEVVDELVLSGQNVIPEALLSHGFIFKYPTITSALQAILDKKI